MTLIGFPGRNLKIGHRDSTASNVLIIFRCHASQRHRGCLCRSGHSAMSPNCASDYLLGSLPLKPLSSLRVYRAQGKALGYSCESSDLTSFAEVRLANTAGLGLMVVSEKKKAAFAVNRTVCQLFGPNPYRCGAELRFS